MASSKLQILKRSIQVASVSWLADVLTINTVAAHGLVDTDVISFTDQNYPEVFSAAITYVDADTFTVPCTNQYIKVPGTLMTGIWNNGATGAQEAFSFGWGNFPQALIQVSTNSTGTVTVKCEGSLDGVKWVDCSGTAVGVTTNNSQILEVTKPYLYGRLNFTVAVGGTLGKVTAFKVVA